MLGGDFVDNNNGQDTNVELEVKNVEPISFNLNTNNINISGSQGVTSGNTSSTSSDSYTSDDSGMVPSGSDNVYEEPTEEMPQSQPETPSESSTPDNGGEETPSEGLNENPDSSSNNQETANKKDEKSKNENNGESSDGKEDKLADKEKGPGEEDSLNKGNNPNNNPPNNHAPNPNDNKKDEGGLGNKQPHSPNNQRLGNNNNNNNNKNPNQDNKNQNNNQRNLRNNQPNNPNKKNNNNDVGENNLKKSLRDKARSLFNRGKNNDDKKDKKNKDKSGGDDSSNDNSSNNSSIADDKKEESAAKKRLKIKIIKLVLILTLVFLAGLFFLVLIISVLSMLGFNISASSLFGSQTYGTSDFVATYEEGTDAHNDEVKYYKKLQELVDKYLENHSVKLNSNYFHTIFMYYYYQADVINESQASGQTMDYKKIMDVSQKLSDAIADEFGDNEIDYSVGGKLYNLLKNNSDLKSFLSKILGETDMDTILSSTFEMAAGMEETEYYDDTVVSEETQVTVTKTTTVTTTPSPGSNVTTTPATTTVTSTKTMTINEYIADAIYANADDFSNAEAVKAYTIAYSTNLVAENKKLTVSSSNAAASGPTCSTTLGCSYDKDGNLVDGPGERSNKNSNFYNGKYYYKTPLSSSAQKELTDNINSVFGNVLVNEDGTYPTLDVNKLTFFGDSDYKNALSQSYGELKTKNVGENSYILDGSYGKSIVKRNVIFYDQKNYPNSVFCGLKGYTIGGSGCGVTAMAIVASTYENSQKYDPVYMNSEARRLGMCGSGGTSQGFFSREARAMKYNEIEGSKYNKSFLNLVLKHLSQGHLVVVRMGSGHFTSGGHYMVLAGVDPTTKKVYVYDPNNKSNSSYRKTGNGWYSYNDIIVKEAYNFYIIWKG